MMALPVLRFNFAAPGGESTAKRERVAAALDMAAWGDKRGIAAVSVDEHHVTGHGWSSNPVMTAALFLQRTTNMFLSIDCALGPLWNPVRLAEDIAFVDAISGGRLHTTIGLGYRPTEYQALQVPFEARGALMDRHLETMMTAWSGASLVEGDPGASIAAGTYSHPHPAVYVGGGVRASARRAVRFGLGLSLPAHLPDLADYYESLCRQAGMDPVLIMPARINRGMVYLCDDPDEAWARLGRHILWEAVVYGGWSGQSARSSMHLPGVETLDEVRSSGRYRFLTPEQLVAEVRECPDYGSLVLHPLVGGMPIDEAWKSLHLLTEKVIPQLSAPTLSTSSDAKGIHGK